MGTAAVRVGLAAALREAMKPVLTSLGVFLLGLLLGAILMLVFGYSPIRAYRALFTGALGTLWSLAETLSFSVPLMLTGLTFAICARAGLFNIGAEGQMYMGAVAAVAAGALLSLPLPLHIVVTIVFSMLVGALWGIVPALLKAYRGVSEVITTIMFNWIAYYLAMYMALNVLVDPARSERTLVVKETARLPVLVQFTSLTAALYVALVVVAISYFLLFFTRFGYELRVFGLNPDAAKYGGMNPKRVIVRAFIVGGIASGLAGCLLIIGRPPSFALYGTLGNVSGYGFDGIGVALIGRNNPIGVVLASFLIAMLRNGGRYMEFYAGVYAELVRAIIGIIVIAMAVPEVYEMVARYYRIRKARRELQ